MIKILWLAFSIGIVSITYKDMLVYSFTILCQHFTKVKLKNSHILCVFITLVYYVLNLKYCQLLKFHKFLILQIFLVKQIFQQFWLLLTSPNSAGVDNKIYPLQEKLFVTYCKHCNQLNKPHSFHGIYSCVEQYDHSCPWVGNDVGKQNRPQFINYLILGLIQQLMVIYTSYNVIIQNNQVKYILVLGIHKKFESLILILNLVAFIPNIIQLIAQFYHLRKKYCHRSMLLLKEYQEYQKQDYVFAETQDQLVLILQEVSQDYAEINIRGQNYCVKQYSSDQTKQLIDKQLGCGYFLENIKQIFYTKKQFIPRW
ncbi:Palmitoyltransferase [Spironucleus salmonicida]|uniref:Palmitoyltransferase n=1 Tax=Spironucleus salmonicida TaxID=348837 RepID=V6LYE8_9EUKA|nr:Palmitoyltransferase [Spironucleus salmonicida]|eukprot:EST45834.1 DHHC zinc finger and transmembrane domain-containing protein [Spironucleus salmonicida]